MIRHKHEQIYIYTDLSPIMSSDQSFNSRVKTKLSQDLGGVSFVAN